MHYLFVPSLDPPSPVQLPTLSQLISSSWEESSKLEGKGRRILGCTGLAVTVLEQYWGNPVTPRLEDNSGMKHSGAGVRKGVKHPHPRGSPFPVELWLLLFGAIPHAPPFPRGSHLPVGEPFEAVVHRQHPVPVDESDPHG